MNYKMGFEIYENQPKTWYLFWYKLDKVKNASWYTSVKDTVYFSCDLSV